MPLKGGLVERQNKAASVAGGNGRRSVLGSTRRTTQDQIGFRGPC